jgi:uncharacterized protein YtpQ (UPF0354 family)
MQDEVLQKLQARADVTSASLQQDGVISVLMKGETQPRIVSAQQIDQLKRNGALADSALDDFVASVTAPRQVLEAIPELSSARPVVRSKSTLDDFDAQLAKSDKPTAVIRHPVVADIEACFAFQTTHGMRYATQADLEALKITEAAFAEAAMRNFDAITLETQWSQSDNALIAQLDGNYESSLLLIDNLWPEIEKALGGPIVVGVPARDSLIAVRADDAAQVAQLRRAMNNKFAYPISSKLLTRENGHWIEFR